MVVIRDDLTSDMGPRGHRAEYTRKCGWIDWAHADPDRKDLKAIWYYFHSPLFLPDGSVDMGQRSWIATIKGDDGQLYSYLRVRFPLEMPWVQRAGSGFPDHNFTGYVRLDPGNTPLFYKRAALALYWFACDRVEYQQSAPYLEWHSHSSYSMEDMLSNRMAFHQLFEGVSADKMIEQAGGWTDRDESLKMSTRVMDAIDKTNADQPKSSDNWDLAYLFNDIADINDDKRGGWNPIPLDFTHQLHFPLIRSDFRTDGPPGSIIGIDWDEYHSDASDTNSGAGTRHTPYPRHWRAQAPATGPGGGGRRPGPVGFA